MPTRLRMILGGVMLLPLCLLAQAQSLQRVGQLDGPWEVLLDLSGFRVLQDGVMRDGRRYLLAANRETGVNASVILESAKGKATTQSCRNVLEAIAGGGPLAKPDPKLYEARDRVVLEYSLQLPDGRFTQQFFRVCIPYKEFYADVNLSKVNLQPGEEKLFQAILETLQFRERARGSLESLEQLKTGSVSFRTRDYGGAIKAYSKALELERARRELPRDLWRVLVDNLGMAYGISGDLKNAKETFEYGLGQEPTYPMFHYNMACTYGEMNDMPNAMASLKRAFELKENSIAGERIPDPRTDNSFQRFMKNKQFRELADTLMKSQ